MAKEVHSAVAAQNFERSDGSVMISGKKAATRTMRIPKEQIKFKNLSPNDEGIGFTRWE